jgi:2-polyprenyl-6-methoxyphenol hydroxylase-like FAD-dependent oxidoreductase
MHCFGGGVPTTECWHFHIKRSNSDILGWQGCHIPKPTWARHAACVVNGVPIVLMGNSMHCFPPDVGQGLNAGMLDAAHFLHMVDDLKKQSNNFNDCDELWSSKLKAYSEERVREAKSICQLIPTTNPWYQYNLHSPVDWIGRYIFMVKKVTISKVFHATQKLSNALGVPNIIMRPPVLSLLTRSNPPLVYSDILRQHRHNTLVLQIMVLIGAIVFASYLDKIS